MRARATQNMRIS